MRATLLLLLLLLPGCVGVDPLQSAIASRGATASDEAMQSAEWVYCKAISVGAWQRRFGRDHVRAAAWRTICSDVVEQVPVEALP